MNKEIDVCVIGGGAGGMSSALGAIKNGARKVLLIERDIELGGILRQCIHNGFGLHHYHEELTGPAFAEKLKEDVNNSNIEVMLKTTVVKITKDKMVHVMNELEGYQVIEAKAIVVTNGCRERTRHQIDIPGKRLVGIMTAGLAQRYLNMDGFLVGKRVFILGSGDIGLIMARRMTLEGAKVIGVAEIMPYSNGLNRNIVQCLHDYNIPLYLSHTVTEVSGKKRVEKITISEVDQSLHVKEGTEKSFDVDTLLLSVGLIPENTLLIDSNVQINPTTNGAYVDDHFQTNNAGIFACGNSLHVHDLVDFVTDESYEAGKYAALYTIIDKRVEKEIAVRPNNNVRYVIPNRIHITDENVSFKFRVIEPIENGIMRIKQGNNTIKELKKSHILPAEMQSIKLNKSLFKYDSDITIEVGGLYND